jgi:hypothetical protein
MTTSVEERIVKIETDLTYIKASVDELKEQQREFINKADERYASKLTEKIAYGLVGTIVTIAIIALLRLVIPLG